VLVELADETVSATERIALRAGICSRIGNRGTLNSALGYGEVAVRVSCLRRRSIDDEAEQQKSQRAGERAVPFVKS
jgi:hypothetical protein